MKAALEPACRAALWLATGVYTLAMLRVTFRCLDRFGMMALDLGTYDQATWLISRGLSPFDTVRGLHILADHFSVVLYLLAPLYWMWDSPKVLLAAQTFALASGALPVYALAMALTRSAPTSLLFAVCYLLYPALGWCNIHEFHPETIATPLLLGGIYCLTQKRWRSYFLLLGLAVLAKETVSLTVMALGLYALRTDRQVGWLTLGFGAATLGIALATVRHFNGGEPSGYFWYYARYGGNPSGIIRYLLQHPLTIASDLNTGAKWQYLFGLLQPVLFLPVVAPEVLLVTAPVLLVNLLSSNIGMHVIQSHYSPTIIPVIFAAGIIGYARLCRRRSLSVAIVLSVNLAAWAAAGSWYIGPLGRHYEPPYPLVSVPDVAEIQHALAIISPDGSVSAQMALVPHLSHRAHVYTFPNPFLRRVWGGTGQALRDDANCGIDTLPVGLDEAVNRAPVDWVVLCPSTLRYPLAHKAYTAFLTVLLKTPSYGIVFAGRSVILLQRGAAHRAGVRLLEIASGSHTRNGKDAEKASRSWMADQPMPP